MSRVLMLAVAALSLVSCNKKEAPAPVEAPKAEAAPAPAPAPRPAELDPQSLAAFAPLPAVVENPKNPLTDDKVLLGRALYYDTRLSASNQISCNTCHLLETYGADGHKTSEGHKKQLGKRNAPTVYNAAGHVAQFWDGRAKDVEEQAQGPIMNPVEMAMNDPKTLVAELGRVKWYREQFARVFPAEKQPITLPHIGDAIGAFERKLMTPSRWDKLLAGDQSALTPEEKAGFQKFVSTGCVTCHNGAFVGGGMFQKLGIVNPWPDQSSDVGRMEVTKSADDRLVFKVPSLRNVEKTAPYFHDGSVGSLEEAVKLMAHHQLGKELSDADVASIVTWLKSLTGDIPRDYVAEFKVPEDAPAAKGKKK